MILSPDGLPVGFDPRKLDWELVELTPSFARWIANLEGDRWVTMTSFLGDEELLAENKQRYDDSYGKRFGENPQVASIPLNVLYSSKHEIMKNMRSGDRDHIKWWLNRPENQQYRTFRGKV